MIQPLLENTKIISFKQNANSFYTSGRRCNNLLIKRTMFSVNKGSLTNIKIYTNNSQKISKSTYLTGIKPLRTVANGRQFNLDTKHPIIS